MSEYSGVIVSGSPIDVFRDSVANTPIKDFTDVTKEAKAAFDAPAALKAQMQNYQNVADAYAATLVYLDSLYENATDTALQTTYIAQMRGIKLQIAATHTQLAQISTLIHTERDLKIETAADLNALLADGEVHQYNKKRVTDIILHTVAQGHNNLTANEWAEIDLIAHQCPYAGGKAVYQARSIYADLSGEI